MACALVSQLISIDADTAPTQRFAVDRHLSSVDASTASALLDVMHGTLRDVAQWCDYSFEDSDAVSSASALSLATRQMMPPLSWVMPRHVRTLAIASLTARGCLDALWVQHQVRWRADLPATSCSHMCCNYVASMTCATFCHDCMPELQAQSAYRALNTQLLHSGGPFLFGAAPSALDAAVYAHLADVRRTQVGTWVAEVAPQLVAMFNNFHARYFVPGAAANTCLLSTDGGPNAFQQWGTAWDARRERLAAAAVAAAAVSAAPPVASAESDAIQCPFGPDAVAATAAARDVRLIYSSPLLDIAATAGIFCIAAVTIRLLVRGDSAM